MNQNKSIKRAVTGVVAAALIISTAAISNTADAAKKPALSKKKLTIEAGKSKKVKVSNAKKAKLSWKSSKKSVVKVKKTGKYGCKITGLKKGKAVVTCKIKKLGKNTILKCKVTVRKASVTPQVTKAPALSNETKTPTTTAAPGTSQSPSASAVPSTAPIASATPNADGFTPVEYKSAGFENGTDGFTGRSGNETLSVAENGYEGKCLYVSKRTSEWHGAKLDVASTIVAGATYKVTAYMKHMGTANLEIKCSGAYGENYPAIADVKNAKAGEWTKLEGTVEIPTAISDYIIYFEIPGSASADFYLDSVTITQISAPKKAEVLSSMYEAYKGIFDYIGVCANYYGYGVKKDQLRTTATVDFIKHHYNSFTLENEMKPEAVLGSSATKISVNDAKALGYVIPDSYAEEKVPQLNFDVIDSTLEMAYKEGLKMRAHTLMWHQQTSPWFFTENYSGSKATTPAVMDARLEFYVRTVMKHVMDKEKELTGTNGSIVYAWDVTNEYLHRTKDPTSVSWVDVYGDMSLEPTYVKKAFQLAYDELKEYGVQDDVTLFYNDYNTYDVADDLVSLVNYINKDEAAKICGGIGMQSHVTIDDPTIDKYAAALDAFLATGLQVQVTELDIKLGSKSGSNTLDDQARYVKEFMQLLMNRQQNRDKSINPKGITGVTIWGLYDTVSWCSGDSPLLFGSSIADPKAAFYAFIEAAQGE